MGKSARELLSRSMDLIQSIKAKGYGPGIYIIRAGHYALYCESPGPQLTIRVLSGVQRRCNTTNEKRENNKNLYKIKNKK